MELVILFCCICSFLQEHIKIMQTNIIENTFFIRLGNRCVFRFLIGIINLIPYSDDFHAK